MHLEKTLSKIQEAGLTLNVAKCEWAKSETNYLGYHLGNGELRPQVDKVEAVRCSPRPRTKKEVRSFLGLVGWYQCFIPNFSTTAVPLTNLLCKRVNNPITWTEECDSAFNILKKQMCSCPVLKSPDFTKEFVVQVDASAVGIGAVLAQGDAGEERPIVYLSRKLLPRETQYSTVEKEGLAIKWALGTTCWEGSLSLKQITEPWHGSTQWRITTLVWPDGIFPCNHTNSKFGIDLAPRTR